MKIQIESLERLESIFSELAEEQEEGHPTSEEAAVLLQIKSLFLRNVEIAGEIVGITQLAEEDTEEKKKHAQIVAQIEEAEIEKKQKIKELCRLRRELPEKVREETEKGYSILNQRLNMSAEALPVVLPAQPEDEAKEISRGIEDLLEALPRLTTRMKENIEVMEKEIGDKGKEKSYCVEAESLSILFKDELELDV